MNFKLKKPPYIIYNKVIPFGKYKGIALYPFIFIKKILKNKKVNKFILNHEKIHIQQQLELSIVFFYILYTYWWITKGYSKIPFELEAHKNMYDLEYLKNRKKYSWKIYLSNSKNIHIFEQY